MIVIESSIQKAIRW